MRPHSRSNPSPPAPRTPLAASATARRLGDHQGWSAVPFAFLTWFINERASAPERVNALSILACARALPFPTTTLLQCQPTAGA